MLITKKPLTYYSLSLAVLFVFCQCKMDEKTAKDADTSKSQNNTPMARLPNSKAGEAIKKAIEFAGGWEQWQEKKTLSYTKTIQFLDSLGNQEREVKQLHEYQLRPSFKSSISWEDEGDRFQIINNGKQAWKLKNGKVLSSEDDTSSAWNSSFGSHYVMCMPFKLTDPGTVLKYEGIDTLANKQVIHKIKTTYEKGAGSAAGLHTWWYYFDKENFKPVANFLDYGDGFSFTQYESFKEVDGIMMNHVRHSYATNADADLLYLRAIYTNEDIQFNVDFSEELFEVKE